ncbi:MAG TPA: hypothetical protein VMR48_02495 [Gaiellaceae bacterium]|jgi:hypothetical protein|nr:hypothetical protein [Gaiellaceae bacterium]
MSDDDVVRMGDRIGEFRFRQQVTREVGTMSSQEQYEVMQVAVANVSDAAAASTPNPELAALALLHAATALWSLLGRDPFEFHQVAQSITNSLFVTKNDRDSDPSS